jgi:hypothetical protein
MAARPLVEQIEQAFQEARAMDAPLSMKLDYIAATVQNMSPAFADTVENFLDRLRRNGAGEAAPKPGDAMPDFLLPDESGRLVSLSQILAEGPAAVVFIGAIGAPIAGSIPTHSPKFRKKSQRKAGRSSESCPKKPSSRKH